jgi:hypothetical protein
MPKAKWPTLSFAAQSADRNSTLATLGEGDLQLVRAADEAADAGGTAASYRDPAVVLIVSKNREFGAIG